jgi:hypothetical protein
VKAEKGCTPSPGLSADHGWMWNWMSGVSTSGAVRRNPVASEAAIVIGPGPGRDVFKTDPHPVEQAADLVVQRRAVAAEDEPGLKVVLQVSPHARQVRERRDPVRPQMLRRPDAPRASGSAASRSPRPRAPPAHRARAVCSFPSGPRQATPVARRPSNRMRVVIASDDARGSGACARA